MYRKLIVGHNLLEGGRDALALGQALAEASAAELVVAGVFPFGLVPRGFDPQWREEEERVAAQLEAVAQAAGVQAEAFPSNSPSRGLHDLAEEAGADVLVVGSSRHAPAGQLIVGNVGLALLQGAPCAVAIAPAAYRERAGRFEAIVVGFDGSAEAQLALAGAVELARTSGARLKLVAVAEPPNAITRDQALDEALEEEVGRLLEEASRSIPEGIHAEAGVVTGDPATRLAEAADADGRLLVVGSRGYGPVRRVLLGSVSAALVRAAPCPLLVHPRGT